MLRMKKVSTFHTRRMCDRIKLNNDAIEFKQNKVIFGPMPHFVYSGKSDYEPVHAEEWAPDGVDHEFDVDDLHHAITQWEMKQKWYNNNC